MPTYEEQKTNPGKFLTFTSLTLAEIADLLVAFEHAYLKVYPASKTKAGKRRKRKTGAGRKSSLDNIEQKLLFAWFTRKAIHMFNSPQILFSSPSSSDFH